MVSEVRGSLMSSFMGRCGMVKILQEVGEGVPEVDCEGLDALSFAEVDEVFAELVRMLEGEGGDAGIRPRSVASNLEHPGCTDLVQTGKKV
jgi:hypothetical protein